MSTKSSETKEVIKVEESKISVIRVKNIYDLSEYVSRVIFCTHIQKED